jgi:hypothetical protein
LTLAFKLLNLSYKLSDNSPGEEKRSAYLEEERGALHEGLSKTLESLRRGSW